MNTVEKEIKKYLKERGWDVLQPGDLAKSIAIESGELLEHFQWSNPSIEEIKKDKKKYIEIQKELADIFIYCLDLSIVLGFNTEKIILEKLKHIKKKYPVKLMKKKESASLYWEIKKEYRKKGK
ncbi:MAG: MazG-like family protein [Candidatus Paceibacterota bacterium]